MKLWLEILFLGPLYLVRMFYDTGRLLSSSNRLSAQLSQLTGEGRIGARQLIAELQSPAFRTQFAAIRAIPGQLHQLIDGINMPEIQRQLELARSVAANARSLVDRVDPATEEQLKRTLYYLNGMFERLGTKDAPLFPGKPFPPRLVRSSGGAAAGFSDAAAAAIASEPPPSPVGSDPAPEIVVRVPIARVEAVAPEAEPDADPIEAEVVENRVIKALKETKFWVIDVILAAPFTVVKAFLYDLPATVRNLADSAENGEEIAKELRPLMDAFKTDEARAEWAAIMALPGRLQTVIAQLQALQTEELLVNGKHLLARTEQILRQVNTPVALEMIRALAYHGEAFATRFAQAPSLPGKPVAPFRA